MQSMQSCDAHSGLPSGLNITQPLLVRMVITGRINRKMLIELDIISYNNLHRVYIYDTSRNVLIRHTPNQYITEHDDHLTVVTTCTYEIPNNSVFGEGCPIWIMRGGVICRYYHVRNNELTIEQFMYDADAGDADAANADATAAANVDAGVNAGVNAGDATNNANIRKKSNGKIFDSLFIGLWVFGLALIVFSRK